MPKRRDDDDGAAAATGGYSTLQGLERAMLMLEVLADRPMRAKELADTLQLPWTTVHRLLTNLRENGYLVRDEATGIFYIGARLYYIGTSHLANLPVVQAARQYLRSAADESGAAAQLVSRHRYSSMNLLVEEQRTQMPNTTIAFHSPLHCGSKGQVLLAYADDEFAEEYLGRPLKALTSQTLTDPEVLRERLAVIRRQGYAETSGDVQPSTASVAAPVFGPDGNVVASVTLITGTSTFEERKAMLRDVVLATTRSISHVMGWRPTAA